MSEQLRVLFVASDVPGERGASLIESGFQTLAGAIRQAGLFRVLDLRFELASPPEALVRELLGFKPHVVHFAGSFPNADASAPDTLAATLAEAARVVVLSAPVSPAFVSAVIESVEFTVLTKTTADSPAAVLFAKSFYRALASGDTVEHAFALGSAWAHLEGADERERPRLLVRAGGVVGERALIPVPPRSPATDKGAANRREIVLRGIDFGTTTDLRGVEDDSATRYRVWFATNRTPVIKDGRLRGFGARPRRRVSHGFCDVVIPASHEIGSVGSPWWKRLLHWEDDRLRVRALEELDERRFWALIREGVAAAGDGAAALVFIHGYNVSFRSAAIRTAQLGFDLKVRGPVAFFSWPSLGRLRDYLRDGSAIESSEGAIATFLADFARETGVERVNVIAHSMGNRGLLRALQRIVAHAGDRSSARFGHLVLAAPDLTRDLFLDVADVYGRMGESTTLYVSDRDRALRASRLLQGDRVGFAPPVTVCPGIDTVYVADVDESFMGHSPFAESRAVLTDIHQLFAFDAPPQRRIGLDEGFTADGRYWLIRK